MTTEFRAKGAQIEIILVQKDGIWMLSCPILGIRDWKMQQASFEDAKREALDRLSRYLHGCLMDVDKLR